MELSDALHMVKHGEWTRQGATLSDVTAQKDYGVDRNFIVQGIRSGKLEYREASMFGNPCLRILRSQLEQYIVEQFGPQHLGHQKNQTELRQIKKEIGSLKRKLAALESRRVKIEAIFKASGPPI
jgi:hypothetical protein